MIDGQPGGLRVIVVGEVSAAVERACRRLDHRPTFVRGAVEVVDAAAPAAEAATLVVSTAMDEYDAAVVVAAEAEADPRSLGFFVHPDHGAVERWLARVGRSRPAVTEGGTAAFLDQPLTGLGIDAIDDVRAGGATAEEAARRARAERGSLLLYGHSNGQCHGAGGVAICDRHAARPITGDQRQLPCFGGAPCRFDAGTAYVRVPAEHIGSEIVIDFTCFGFVLGDHALRAIDGVGRALLDGPRVRALVTSLRASTPNHHDYALAAYLAHDGVDMGRLAGALNRARTPEEAPDFLCVGDPRRRLGPRILEAVPAEWTGPEVRRPHAAPDGAHDLRVLAAPARGEVMLHSGASAAAWAPDGTLYLTLPPGSDRATVRRVPTEAARLAVATERLLPQLDFLEHYVASLRSHPLAAADHDLAAALDAVDDHRRALRHLGLTVHPTSLRDGAAIRAASVAGPSRLRLDHLGRLAASLRDVHLRTLDARSLLFDAGTEVLAAYGPEVPGPRCDYCGGHTTHRERRLAGSSFARTAAFCQRCGRIFEGARLATRIEVAVAGPRLDVRVDVQNPFPFEVPVSGVVALQTFGDAANTSTALATVLVEAGCSQVLQAQVEVSPEVPAGVHRIKAAITIGPQVELLVRYWAVGSDDLC